MRPTSDEIRLELERILASEPFANTNRLSRFLTFVVERTLAGESDGLKEFVIGVEVFDRDAAYDPRIDSIVRVEAGRLRTKIEEYYRGAGRGDPVVIKMEKGGYAPVFELRAPTPEEAGVRDATVSARAVAGERTAPASASRRSTAATAGLALVVAAALVVGGLIAAAWRTAGSDLGLASEATRIAVLPFAPYADSDEDRMLAVRLTEGVTAELVREGSLEVVSSTSASASAYANARGSLVDVAEALDADVLMEARIVVTGERLRVEARLADGPLNRKFWVESFGGDIEELESLERQIATAAAAAAAERP